ncbi:cell division protein ZapE [Gammaproteobacteria bacterium]|nr:cell division protein ZapE [Gammaproteobacteria bacterium]
MSKGNVLAKYRDDVASGKISEDSEQVRIVGELQRLLNELEKATLQGRGLRNQVKRAFGRANEKPCKGLYLWGGVGRGKTYLMDLFFDSVDSVPKRRTHFHRFMQEVHQRLAVLQGHKNPLVRIADELAKEAKLLCFDEFFVQDIADAMLLAGLLDALFERGVVLVTTSNIQPDGLYRNGLQRARFLPAIALLNAQTKVVEIRSGIDYRLRSLEQATLYHSPDDAQARSAMLASLHELVPSEAHLTCETPIEVLGRELRALWVGDDVVWFDFAELCDGPRSAFDYVGLARLFHTMLISGIPVFDETRNDQARRFINLIDELYDRRVKLIASATAPILALYTGTQLSFEFERTASRLLEMQSLDYLATAHRG